MMYGLFLVSIKIREMYNPTTPTESKIKPPKLQTETITEIQPSRTYPVSLRMIKPMVTRDDTKKITNPRKKTP
jgi:hypothetical protein